MPIPVLLVFSEDILYHDHDMLFLDRGGGNRDKVVTSDPREALGSTEMLFSAQPVTTIKRSEMPNSCTTKRLVSGISRR